MKSKNIMLFVIQIWRNDDSSKNRMLNQNRQWINSNVVIFYTWIIAIHYCSHNFTIDLCEKKWLKNNVSKYNQIYVVKFLINKIDVVFSHQQRNVNWICRFIDFVFQSWSWLKIEMQYFNVAFLSREFLFD